MFCPECGVKLPDNAKFCISCGCNIKAFLDKQETSKVQTGDVGMVKGDIKTAETSIDSHDTGAKFLHSNISISEGSFIAAHKVDVLGVAVCKKCGNPLSERNHKLGQCAMCGQDVCYACKGTSFHWGHVGGKALIVSEGELMEFPLSSLFCNSCADKSGSCPICGAKLKVRDWYGYGSQGVIEDDSGEMKVRIHNYIPTVMCSQCNFKNVYIPVSYSMECEQCFSGITNPSNFVDMWLDDCFNTLPICPVSEIATHIGELN